MERMRFTRNRQNTRSFGNFWREVLLGRRYSSSQVTPDSVSRSETCMSVLFEIKIPCFLLFLNWNHYQNSQNSPKRMHPKCFTCLPTEYNSFLITFFSSLKKEICFERNLGAVLVGEVKHLVDHQHEVDKGKLTPIANFQKADFWALALYVSKMSSLYTFISFRAGRCTKPVSCLFVRAEQVLLSTRIITIQWKCSQSELCYPSNKKINLE